MISAAHMHPFYTIGHSTRIGAKVVLLRVIEQYDDELTWLGVAEVMQSEARQQATAPTTRGPGQDDPT
jgi:hypothetical protein